jgi:predicted transcriptional regulator
MTAISKTHKLLQDADGTQSLSPREKKASVVAAKESVQSCLDVVAASDAYEGIRQGLEDAEAGRCRPAIVFFEEFEKSVQRNGLGSLGAHISDNPV